MENQLTTERSILWNKIYEKVKQLPIAKIEGDAVDHLSLTYNLEELFLAELCSIKIEYEADLVSLRVFEAKFKISQSEKSELASEKLLLEEQIIKTPKERDNADLFQLCLELYARSSSQPHNKTMHDYAFEAINEMKVRLSKPKEVDYKYEVPDNFGKDVNVFYKKREVEPKKEEIAEDNFRQIIEIVLNEFNGSRKTYTEIVSDIEQLLIKRIPHLQKPVLPENIICPKCGGVNEYLTTKTGYKCAFTECRNRWDKLNDKIKTDINKLSETFSWADNNSILFAQFIYDNFTFISVEYKGETQSAWVNHKKHTIYINGSDLHKTEIIARAGEDILDIYNSEEFKDFRETKKCK